MRRVVIGLPVAVAIARDVEVLELDIYVCTVGAALEHAGVEVDDRDQVGPPGSHPLDRVTDITVRQVESLEEIIDVATSTARCDEPPPNSPRQDPREDPGRDELRRST